ncbi:MAG: guanylate kinase [Phycisphaerae bacterium]|nr:guanylate kinase [Phycisphaerae bacterium]
MTPHDEHHRLPTDTDDGVLLIISGPSGVGKTTITRGVERTIPDAIFSVSVTTRQKTEHEVDGVDYWFIDEEEFKRLRDDGDLLEHAEVFGSFYGTPQEWVDAQLERGRVVILEIDVQGATVVKERMPDALALFILPPDEPTLLERLRSRDREDESKIQRRFGEAKREIEYARSSGAYDHFIVNDEVDRAISEAVEIVRARRGR